MKIVFEKIVLFIMVLFIAAGIAAPAVTNAANAVDLYDASSKKSNFTIGTDQEIELQFKTKAAFTRVGIYVGFNSNDKEMVISLYKWNSNTRGSKKSDPVFTKTLTGWSKNELVYIDASEAGSSSFTAGEYVLTLYIVKGNNLRFTWYEGKCDFAQGYIDDYGQAGSPMSEIYFANGEGAEALDKKSEATNVGSVEVPPEYVIPEDHPIKQLNVDSTRWTFVDGLGRPAVE